MPQAYCRCGKSHGAHHRAIASSPAARALRRLFDAPTVAEMAEALGQEASDPAALEQTAQLLLRVAGLSDEDVQTMLAERVPRQPPVS